MIKKKSFKKVFSILALCLVALAYNNCGQFVSNSVFSVDSSLQNDFDAGPILAKEGALSGQVHSILQRRCASCHNSEISFGGIDDITNLTALKDTGLIHRVYSAVESGRMPPSDQGLTEVEISLIDKWRNGGTTLDFSTNYNCSVEAAELSSPTENRIWAITRDEYQNVISDVFNINNYNVSSLPEPLVKDHFKNHTESMVIDDYVFSVLTNFAEDIAQTVAQDENKVKQFWSCSSYSVSSASDDCKKSFISNLLSILHRKTVTSSEVDNYLNIFNLADDIERPVQKGVENTIFAALISPNFIYKKEVGGNFELMGNQSIAESLAFQIWQSIPDQALLEAADNEELQDPEVREAQIRRMLNTAQGKQFFNRFIMDYFEIDNLQSIGSDQNLKNSLMTEFNFFIDDVIRQPSSLSSLFNLSETVVDSRLSRDIYKIGDRQGRFQHNQSERSGILTLPAYLYSTSSDAGLPSHISRGVFVREKLLCQPLGAPPDLDDMAERNTKLPENLSAREFFELTHLTKNTCKSCHSMIDPIGFAVDHFNSFGAVIQNDPATGRKIDTSGFINFTSSTDANFNGAAQLSQVLGQSSEVADCFVEQSYKYLLGASIDSNNLCAVENLKQKFKDSNKNIFELVVSILNDNQRYTRQK